VSGPLIGQQKTGAADDQSATTAPVVADISPRSEISTPIHVEIPSDLAQQPLAEAGAVDRRADRTTLSPTCRLRGMKGVENSLFLTLADLR